MDADISSAYVARQQQRCLLSAPHGISVPNVAKEKKGKTPKRPPLTEVERDAARKLKARWLAIPDGTRPTQEKMGEMWGEGGSQSLISQYLNGIIPLNVTAAIRFAHIFKCKPEDILDVPELHGRPTAEPANLPSNVAHIQKPWPFTGVPRDLFDRLPDLDKGEIIGLMKIKIRELDLKTNAGKKKLRR
jgi:hypothetical protein